MLKSNTLNFKATFTNSNSVYLLFLQVLSLNSTHEKDFEEMVFGALPFTGLDECIKLHRKKDNMIWSIVFKPTSNVPTKTR